MVRVMIRCPETGLAVFTGMLIAAEDKNGAVPTAKNAVGCPNCGDLHDWSAMEAWFEPWSGEDISQPEAGGNETERLLAGKEGAKGKDAPSQVKSPAQPPRIFGTALRRRR